MRDGLVLGGPSHATVHLICDGISYTLDIEQGVTRMITVRAQRPVDWASLISPLSTLERLLMVFDGAFVPLEGVQYSGSPENDDGIVESKQMLARRLSYFTTDGRFAISDKLVDYQDHVDDVLLREWQRLLGELDIANQMYLYILADSGMPVDLRLAFLVELAEPMVEIVNKEERLYPSLRPGERGTSLKQCLNALIASYGRDIFSEEMSGQDFDDVLTTLVRSRVRIMHIKTKMPPGKYYDGPCSVHYMRKMSLLYRVVLLELLGIPQSSYQSRLRARVASLNAHRSLGTDCQSGRSNSW